MTIKHQLISELEKVLFELGIEGVTPVVDYPADSKHGDYSTNAALIAAKKLKRNPMEVAQEIVDNFKFLPQGQAISNFKFAIAPPGFVNFWVKDEALLTVIASESEAISDTGKGRKVIVEYSSPNIAKPFTIGHLRSTIIGDAIANLFEATGWKVYRDNHLGDWGTQFGKQIYAIKKWGNEEEIEKSDRPVKLLVELYVKFHEEAEKDSKLEDEAREWFKKLEDGDSEAKKLWQKCIDWSWREFETIYQKLDIIFTENGGRGYGESFFEDKMSAIIEELEEKKLLKVGENGAKLVFFPEERKMPALMILKKDGASLYATRDLATDKFRLGKYGKDVLVINEVGAEQSLYWEQIFQTEYMLGWYKKGQRIHKKHGLYRFKEGKMSTRKGNVIWLEEVLEEAEKKAGELGGLEGEEGLELAKIVGMGALKWNDLKRASEQDIVFDWDEILNMQGNSGPYIQYTFARTQSVLLKAGISNFKFQISNWKLENEERNLLLLLSRFPEIVAEAGERLAPNLLCTYLFELAQAFNLFYQKRPILKPEGREGLEGKEGLDAIRNFRLGLTQATGEILKKGLNLLGIKAPERM